MGETKHTSKVDDALRELTKQRDRMLSEAPAISSARLAFLNNLLARQFPIEAALREVGVQRDELLNKHQLQMPPSVERALQRELALSEATDERSRALWTVDWRTHASGWLRLFRWPAPAAAVAICLFIAAGIIRFRERSPSGDRTEERTQVFVENRPNVDSGATRDRLSMEPEGLLAGELGPDQIASMTNRARRVSAAREPFGLRISTAELAYLQASFLANSRVSPDDGAEERVDMRLDLPVRAILLEDGIARTP